MFRNKQYQQINQSPYVKWLEYGKNIEKYAHRVRKLMHDVTLSRPKNQLITQNAVLEIF